VEKRRPCPFRKVLNECRKAAGLSTGLFSYVLHITRVSLIGDIEPETSRALPEATLQRLPRFIVFCRATAPLISSSHSCVFTFLLVQRESIYQHVRRTSQSSTVSIRRTFSICKIEDSALGSGEMVDCRLSSIILIPPWFIRISRGVPIIVFESPDPTLHQTTVPFRCLHIAKSIHTYVIKFYNISI
jgi:hypothetical protein